METQIDKSVNNTWSSRVDSTGLFLIPSNSTTLPVHLRSPSQKSHTKLNTRTRLLDREAFPPTSVLGQKRQHELVDLTADGTESDESLPIIDPRKKSRSTTSSPGHDQPPERNVSVSSNSSSDKSTSSSSTTQSRDRQRQVVSAVKVPGAPRPSPTKADIKKRELFNQNLRILPGVTLRNDVDNDTPPTSFTFVKESVLQQGVYRAPEDVMLGCTCQKRYKQALGCVYLEYCSCIEDSAVDNNGKKCFPYGASDNNYRCLRNTYLNSRNHVYECNKNCDCTADCKNRVVQHGRQVALEIFKTTNRGWGLRCRQDLKKGQFVETYRGEIITSEEADRRGTANEDEDNFLFDFDKFEGSPAFDPERRYVCDGRYMGSPARFINHSCDPNLRLFTVSYNHYDRNIYELAFFATDFIPKGTELTFDYYDEDDPTIISDAMADDFEKEKGYRPTKCLCGSEDCRRYFFH